MNCKIFSALISYSEVNKVWGILAAQYPDAIYKVNMDICKKNYFAVCEKIKSLGGKEIINLALPEGRILWSQFLKYQEDFERNSSDGIIKKEFIEKGIIVSHKLFDEFDELVLKKQQLFKQYQIGHRELAKVLKDKFDQYKREKQTVDSGLIRQTEDINKVVKGLLSEMDAIDLNNFPIVINYIHALALWGWDDKIEKQIRIIQRHRGRNDTETENEINEMNARIESLMKNQLNTMKSNDNNQANLANDERGEITDNQSYSLTFPSTARVWLDYGHQTDGKAPVERNGTTGLTIILQGEDLAEMRQPLLEEFSDYLKEAIGEQNIKKINVTGHKLCLELYSKKMTEAVIELLQRERFTLITSTQNNGYDQSQLLSQFGITRTFSSTESHPEQVIEEQFEEIPLIVQANQVVVDDINRDRVEIGLEESRKLF